MNFDLSNYHWGLPVQASSYASKIDHSLMILHGAMFLIFGLWLIYFIYCLIRYRRGKNGAALYTHKTSVASYTPDIVILAFEIWLIFIIGVPIWAYIREKLPPPKEATEVHVVAEQFAWLFHYPGPDGIFGKRDPKLVNASNPLGLDENDPFSKDDIVSVNEFHLPVGKPVLIQLTSLDVIHSFFVPEFRTKQDAVPGMNIRMWFEPIKTGRFELGCAQLCGTGHYRMRGDVYVTAPEEYQTWLNQMGQQKQAATPPKPKATETWDY